MKLVDKVINKIKKDKEYPWLKFYKKEDRNIEVPNISVYERLKETSTEHLSAIALNYFNKVFNYDKLLTEIDTCARALKSQGVREGDVVTICMANTPEAVISFYAVNKIGAISNIIHPLSASEEIKRSLLSTNSVCLIAINMSYEKIQEIIDDTKVYKLIIVSPADSMPTLLSIGYFLTQGRKVKTPVKNEMNLYWKDFMDKGKKYTGRVLVKTTKDQPAVILHSGGTTGTPKNIVLTNGNINTVTCQARVIFPNLGVGDKLLAILPIFHCFGLVVGVHAPLVLGATSILIPQFDAKKFDKLLTEYKPTVITGVPTLFEALLNNKNMDKVNLSFVKYIISGGDSLPPEKNKIINAFLAAHHCRTHIIQGYGMTESAGPVTASVLQADKLGSVGIPFPGNIIKIVDKDTREEVCTGEVGEILISGPTVMMGYLDNEKETNEILEKDEKGRIWVHTGDLGYLDEDGCLFFVQRLKRMLIVSGYNVYPSHIEDVLLKHPYVSTCGVIGIPHPYKVQVPKAFIVLKSNVELTNKVKKEIKEYCQKNLANYMIPKEFVFKESLPKTMIGKINYRLLEEEKM